MGSSERDLEQADAKKLTHARGDIAVSLQS